MNAPTQAVVLIRMLAIPSIIAGFLAMIDGLLPNGSVDEAIVKAKEAQQTRGTTYNITAQGRWHYNESVSRNLHATVSEGTILRVTLTPIFSEWKRVEVMNGGQPLLAERGNDLVWMPFVGLALLLPALSFRHASNWFNVQYLIVIGVIEFGGLLVFGKLILVGLGFVEKM